MTDTLFIIGDAVMLVALLGVLTFTLSYALFFAWRRTEAGRALMYFSASLTLWGVQSFAARMDPDYPGRGWLRVIVYIFIAVTVWRLVATLWRSWSQPFMIEPRDRKHTSKK